MLLQGEKTSEQVKVCEEPIPTVAKVNSMPRNHKDDKSILLTKLMILLRIGIFLLLASLIGVLGYGSFYFLRDAELKNFQQVFQSSADRISISVDHSINSKLLVADMINNIYSYAMKDGFIGQAPNITLPGFDKIVGSLRKITSSKVINFAPIVTSRNRASWEAYAAAHISKLDGPQGLEEHIPKGSYCKAKDGSNVYDLPDSRPDSLYPDVFTPIWQITPMSVFWRALLYDMHCERLRRNVIDAVISTKKAGFTDIIQLISDQEIIPSTIMYAPVKDLDTDAVVAVSSLILSWDDVLRDALPSYISGISCVLSTSTQTFTMLLKDGDVKVLGVGDLHDSKYDEHEQVITASVTAFTSVSASDYTITLYPTDELHGKHITNTPIIVSSSIIGIVVFTALVVMLYDYFLRAREKALEGAVESTTRLSNMTLHELKVKKNFVRYISHEIRTPLSAVKMGLDVLAQDLIRGISVQSCIATVEEIKVSCEASLEVVNDFLLFDKIVSDTLKLEFKEANIRKLVEDSVKPFLLQARKKEITLSTENELFGADLSRGNNIRVDNCKLTQVMRNLLSNALKFTPKNGKVTVRIRRVDADMMGTNQFAVDVIDSGAGISKENQSRLFKEVVQFNANELQEGGGSGLGMCISHGIMKQHGGSLSVWSQGEGFGSTFTVQIPIYESVLSSIFSSRTGSPSPLFGSFKITGNTLQRETSHESLRECEHTTNDSNRLSWKDNSVIGNTVSTNTTEEGSSILKPFLLSAPGPSDNLACTSKNVLVVDDSAMNRRMLARMLGQATPSYNCTLAVDGAEAVRIIQQSLQDCADPSEKGEGEKTHTSQFDAILMDYSMPNLTGPLAASIIRELGYKGIIIGATGYADSASRDEFLSHGVNQVLVKPIELCAFRDIMRECRGVASL